MSALNRVLKRLENVCEEGEGYKASCPVPAHGQGRGDRNPSLSVATNDKGNVLLKCFANCENEAVVEALGLKMADFFEQRNGSGKGHGNSRAGGGRAYTPSKSRSTHQPSDPATLENYAAYVQLPLEFLKSLGLTQIHYGGEPAVKMPYLDASGEEVLLTRFRVSLTGKPKVKTKSGDKHRLYGLWKLEEARAAGYAFLVEGESDCQTLWFHGEPGAGIPGANGWKQEWAADLEGIGRLYFVVEDEAGEACWEKLAATPEIRDRLYRVELEGVKDVSELHKQDPEGFTERLAEARAGARAWLDIAETEEPEVLALEPVKKNSTFTAAELMAEKLASIRWVVPDILPEGVTLLAGKPKLGKSWMALALGIATATGGVALGTKKVEQGSCLYLALEDNKRRLQKRLRKLLAGGEAPEDLHINTAWPRMNEGGVDQLRVWLEENPDARLIVIDTLAKVRPQAKGQNVYSEDYAALEDLLPLSAEYGVAIVVVHHLRKMAASDPLDEISGSTGLSGGVDGFLILKRDRGEADAYLHVDGRDIEDPAELALKWDNNVASWTLVGNAEEYRQTEERRQVIDLLRRSDGPMGPKGVAEALDRTSGSVRVLLAEMVKAGQVSNPSYGKYTTPNSANSPNSSAERPTVSGPASTPNTLEQETPANVHSVSGVSGVSGTADDVEVGLV